VRCVARSRSLAFIINIDWLTGQECLTDRQGDSQTGCLLVGWLGGRVVVGGWMVSGEPGAYDKLG